MAAAQLMEHGWHGLRAGALVGTIAMAGAFLAASLSLLVPRELIIGRIADGFESGQLVPEDNPLSGHWRIGRDQWTDCATFQMAIRGDASALREMVTPRRFSESPCPVLQEFVLRPGAEYETWRYHQYVHGTTTLTRLALGLGSVAILRNSIRASLLLLVGVVLIGRIVRLRADRSQLSWALLVLALIFPATVGLHEHGASVSHGVTAGVLLMGFGAFVLPDLRRVDPERLRLMAATFGALTAIVEWLDGGTPLGLALILGILGLYALSVALQVGREEASRLGLAAWSAALAFVAAVATCFFLKISAATVVYGRIAARQFARQLLRWTGPEGSIGESVRALIDALDVVGLGSDAGGSVVVGSATILGALALVGLLRIAGWRPWCWLVLASAAIVPTWFLVLRNHTIVHAWFMARLLAWPIALGFSLFAFWITSVVRADGPPNRLA